MTPDPVVDAVLSDPDARRLVVEFMGNSMEIARESVNATASLTIRTATNPGLHEDLILEVRLPGRAVDVVDQVINSLGRGSYEVFIHPGSLGVLQAAFQGSLDEGTATDAGAASQPASAAPGKAASPAVSPAPKPDRPLARPPSRPTCTPPSKPAPSKAATIPLRDLLDPTRDAPVPDQFLALTHDDQVRLATHGNRFARGIVIRHGDKRLHVEVVKNPEITLDEVAAFTASPGLSERAIRAILENKRLVGRRDIVMNLVVNPHTPRSSALQAIKSLRPAEVVHLVRCPWAPKVILTALERRLDQFRSQAGR